MRSSPRRPRRPSHAPPACGSSRQGCRPRLEIGVFDPATSSSLRWRDEPMRIVHGEPIWPAEGGGGGGLGGWGAIVRRNVRKILALGPIYNRSPCKLRGNRMSAAVGAVSAARVAVAGRPAGAGRGSFSVRAADRLGTALRGAVLDAGTMRRRRGAYGRSPSDFEPDPHACRDPFAARISAVILGVVRVAYGIFHRSGPDTGKAVVASYCWRARRLVSAGVVAALSRWCRASRRSRGRGDAPVVLPARSRQCSTAHARVEIGSYASSL